MKKNSIKIMAALLTCAMTVTLVVDKISKKDVFAAKKPVLSFTGKDLTLYIGKQKKISLKNINKKDVKSLSVKSGNSHSVKISKKSKTSFTMKSQAPYSSAVKVDLTLKKKIGGKKKYTWDLTVYTGVADKPVVLLGNTLAEGLPAALVLKEGDAPKGGDNSLFMQVLNMNEIGKLNLAFTMYEDGKKIAYNGKEEFRPDTKKVKNQERGFDLKTYYFKAKNCLSNKTAESNIMNCLIVTQKYIDEAVASFGAFLQKHPYASADMLPTDPAEVDAYLKDFKESVRGVKNFESLLGITNETLAALKTIIDLQKVSPQGVAQAATFIGDNFKQIQEKLLKVAKYLSLDENLVNAYVGQLGFIIQKSLTDLNYDLTKLYS